MLSFGLAIGVAVAAVLCVGLLALIGLLGLRQFGISLPLVGRSGEEKEEMEWDNSALNITVNPLDDLHEECLRDENCEVTRVLKVNEDYSKAEETDELSEDEKPKCSDIKELEWDDSTLSY